MTELREFRDFRFVHNGIEYIFKWAKRQHVIQKMPQTFGERLTQYFSLVAQGAIPQSLFNNPHIKRCSKFRVKYLKRGSHKQIENVLTEKGKIQQFSLAEGDLPNAQSEIEAILHFTQQVFQKYADRGYKDYSPSHDEVLAELLLKLDSALSTEVPVWTHKKNPLERCIVHESTPAIDCAFSHSITGHVDLLLWDAPNNQLIVADYKPEGYFLRSLPQIAFYGLMLRRNLAFPHISCLSFNKNDAWLYDPEIIKTDLEKLIKIYGDPPLKWRRIAQAF